MAKFSKEQKIEAVKLYLNGNESYKTVAKGIGVAKSKLIYWVKYINITEKKPLISAIQTIRYNIN